MTIQELLTIWTQTIEDVSPADTGFVLIMFRPGQTLACGSNMQPHSVREVIAVIARRFTAGNASRLDAAIAATPGGGLVALHEKPDSEDDPS